MTNEELLERCKSIEYLLPPEPTGTKAQLILYDMYNTAKTATNNFTDVRAISSNEIDVRPLLKRENVDTDKWIKEKGTFKRSEYQSIVWMCDEIEKKYSKDRTSNNEPEEADDEELFMMEIEAEALILELELLKRKRSRK